MHSRHFRCSGGTFIWRLLKATPVLMQPEQGSIATFSLGGAKPPVIPSIVTVLASLLPGIHVMHRRLAEGIFFWRLLKGPSAPHDEQGASASSWTKSAFKP